MIAFFCSGAAVGVILWGVAWALGAGGHGTRLPFMLFFPWSWFLWRIAVLNEAIWVLVFLCFLEMPLYGLFIGLFPTAKQRLFALVGISVAHVGAIAACFLPEPFYRSFW